MEEIVPQSRLGVLKLKVREVLGSLGILLDIDPLELFFQLHSDDCRCPLFIFQSPSSLYHLHDIHEYLRCYDAFSVTLYPLSFQMSCYSQSRSILFQLDFPGLNTKRIKSHECTSALNLELLKHFVWLQCCCTHLNTCSVQLSLYFYLLLFNKQ